MQNNVVFGSQIYNFIQRIISKFFSTFFPTFFPTYEGEWENGKRQGQGTCKYGNGATYEGQWENDKMHGKGTFKYANGDIYEGQWENDKMHGKGTFKYANGNIYEGQWENDKRHGEGTFKYANGDIYEGQWDNGKKHGEGTYIYSSGMTYKGQWENGKKHGEGTLISSSGNIITTGKYCDGLLTELQSVTIKEGKKIHFFEYKDGKLFYVESDAKEEIEIDLKINKRILPVLEQFANTHSNQKSNDDPDVIKVQDSEDFQQKIIEEKEQSTTSQSAIVKMFEVPGHAFTMVFENGECSCFDNGGLQNQSLQEYFKVLQNNNTEYHQLNSSDSLTLQTIDGKKIQIPIDPKDFVCRHKANVIFEKLQELNSQPRTGGLFESFLEYYKKTGGIVRAASFLQLANPEIQHCQPSL